MKIGIDLGTTNSAVAYIDPREAEDTAFPPVHILPIPQHVAPERIEPLTVLPSFLYLANAEFVGAYARDAGNWSLYVEDLLDAAARLASRNLTLSEWHKVQFCARMIL